MGIRGVVLAAAAPAIASALWAAWVSRREKEPLATRRLLLLAALLFFWSSGAALLPGWGGLLLSWGWVVALGAGVVLLLPFRGASLTELGRPVPGVDERDIMFSRAVLEPGTTRFEEYYRAHPEFRTRDDLFRLEAGLLSPRSSQYHSLGFPSADAAFWTIEMLRPFVEGGGVVGGGAGLKSEGSEAEWPGGGGGRAAQEQGRTAGVGPGAGPESGGPPGTGPRPGPLDPLVVTRFLKGWTLKLGAHSAGVTELKDYHLYSHVGRGEGYGKRVALDHPFALALTVEMDREMVDPAPRSPTVMESARQYLHGGVMAIQLAELIRRLGYRARAHVDGSYRVICPLVAKDAGLGELGRMGLLMTPKLGPRVRIAVVTTDLPLVADAPFREPSTVDFCLHCRKCAEACPSRALPFGDPEEDERGVLRWRIDAEACFTLWSKVGTDCARCMAVCPYSHPDTLLHDGIRWGIRNNALFRRGAVWMDDLLYGRRPPPKALPDWMEGMDG